jgi:hypothetical protein
MRRSHGVLFTFLSCAGCSESASLAARPRPRAPETASVGASELPVLPVLARTGRPPEPVRILEPPDGVEVDAASASGLSVRVRGPASLLLSLDGARPRPVVSEALRIADLLDPNDALAAGAHDLVLAAVGSDGLVLEPTAGGVASVRFFVGPRPTPPAPPRIVCLAPFGTFYGAAPGIALDFVVASGNPTDANVEISPVARRARASGRGPFALGDFESGDYRVTLEPVPGTAPTLPGRCVFTYNRELERSP